MSRLKLLLLAAAVWALGIFPALAASSNVNALTASGAVVSGQLFYCPIGASTDLKCTAAQIAAFNYSLMSGSCTATSAGVVTCGLSAFARSGTFSIVAADNGTLLETTGTGTATLPALTAGLGYGVVVMNAGAGTVTLASNGGATNINNAGSAALTATVALSAGQQIGCAVNAAVSGWDCSPTSGPAGPTGATGATGAAGASAFTGPGYVPSVWFTPFGVFSQNISGSTLAATTAACGPFWLPNVAAAGGGSGTIGAFSIGIITAGTTTAQMAIYANDASPTVAGASRPGAILLNASSGQAVSNQPNTTPAGQLTFTFSPGVSLAANALYWACLQSNDTTFKYRAQISANGATPLASMFVGTASSASNGSTGAPVNGVTTQTGITSYGVWPSTFHGATFLENNSATTGAPPWISLQFVTIP